MDNEANITEVASMEEVPSSQPLEPSGKKQISQKQSDHLKYARAVQRVKMEQKRKMEEVLNNSLDFIYTRLTNIEKQMSSLVKRPRTHIHISEDEKDNLDELPEKKKARTANDKKEEVVPQPSENWKGLALQTTVLIVTTIAANLLRNGLGRAFRTKDGDVLGYSQSSYYSNA